MSKLGFILQNLMAGAQVDHPATTRLPSGLSVTARLTREGLRCLSLTRTETQAPSQKEAETCAGHLGWTGARIVTATSRNGRFCLLVFEAWPTLQTPEQTSPLTLTPEQRETHISHILSVAGQRDAYWATTGYDGRRAGLEALTDTELLHELTRYQVVQT